MVKNEPLDPSLNTSGSHTSSTTGSIEHRSQQPYHQDFELNRRMDFLDQSFRTQNSRYLLNMDYSPPPSPASQQVLSCLDKSQHAIHSSLMGNLMSRNSNHPTNNAPGSSATDSPSIPSSAAGNEHTSLKIYVVF